MMAFTFRDAQKPSHASVLPGSAAMWQILQSTGFRICQPWEVWYAQLWLQHARHLHCGGYLHSLWLGLLAGYHCTGSSEGYQGHESERKLERSLLSARVSLDVVCLRERETSSKVGRSLGFFDMHCLPSLRPRPAPYSATHQVISNQQTVLEQSSCLQ